MLTRFEGLMAQAKQNYSQGVIYVLIATLGWSLSGIFVRLMPGLNGWQINCWRGLSMSAALLVYLLARYGKDTLDVFKKVPPVALFLSSMFFALGTTCYVTSLTLVSTATVSIIGATSPLVTGLLSPWITGEKPGFFAWVSAVLAVVGMAYIAKDGIETGHVAGLLLSLGVPLTFALQTLMLRRYREIDMMPSICIGGFLAFLLAAFFGQFSAAGGSPFSINSHSFWLLMLMGPLQLTIPLIFYGMGARSVSAISLSLIAMLDAVINPLWPWLFVGEVPAPSTILGGQIILTAVVLCLFGNQIIKAFAPKSNAD
jgi:drug/metabolite transporter, DME family